MPNKQSFRDDLLAHLKNGDAETGAQIGRRWLVQEPDNALAFALTAECLITLRYWAQAIELLKVRYLDDQSDLRIAKDLAVSLFQTGAYDEALEICEAVAPEVNGASDFAELRARILHHRQRKILFETMPYMDAYREYMNYAVVEDPVSAVGGLWDEIGQLQFNFLIKHGLKEYNSLLDIGCGTLRSGRFFINFLRKSRYFAVDFSIEAINAAKLLVDRENLGDKKPNFYCNSSGIIDPSVFGNGYFDFLLAQSVFTHLPSYLIESCFANIRPSMNDNSIFFFTFNQSCENSISNHKDHSHRFDFFEECAHRHGFAVRLIEDYNHPRGQTMAQARLL